MTVSRSALFRTTINPSSSLAPLRPIVLPFVAGVFLACLLVTAIDGPQHIAINGSFAALNAMQVLVIGFIILVPIALPIIAGERRSFFEPSPRVVAWFGFIISASRPWLHAVNSDARSSYRARPAAHPRARSRRLSLCRHRSSAASSTGIRIASVEEISPALTELPRRQARSLQGWDHD